MAAKPLPIDKYGAVFDAHVHTYFDFHDGRMSPEQLVKTTLKWGFNWVNAMSHDTIRGFPRIQRIAKDYNLPCVPAMEISTGYNHLLAFGVQEWKYAKDSWDPEFVIKELRKQGCAIYLSHPTLSPWRGPWTPEIAKRLDVDGIEWNNASGQILNRKTYRQFKYYPKARIAGTDAHHQSNMGFAFTQVNVNSTNNDDLVQALRKGKCRPGGRYIPIHRVAGAAIISLIRKGLKINFPIEGKSIRPNFGKMGWQPAEIFSPDRWIKKLLRKEPYIDF
jgi:hypothetical protein